MDRDDILVQLTNVKNSTENAHKRIDELQVVVNAFYNLAADVKVMANELVNMKTDISDIKQKVDSNEEEPKKLLFNAKSTAIVGIVSALVGSLMALILK